MNSCSELVNELVKRWPDKNAQSAPKKKLLIVDDNVDYCQMFQKAFERYGYYDTYIAHTGEEGLELFSRHQPFLVVFLDLVLPGMNGIELFEKIRELNPLQYVVVITGEMNESFFKQLEKFSCYGTALKPIDFNVMAAILASHINPPVA